ncbi:hypothetical protein GCM10028833_09230 [Glycomyces tarimensis]
MLTMYRIGSSTEENNVPCQMCLYRLSWSVKARQAAVAWPSRAFDAAVAVVAVAVMRRPPRGRGR